MEKSKKLKWVIFAVVEEKICIIVKKNKNKLKNLENITFYAEYFSFYKIAYIILVKGVFV